MQIALKQTGLPTGILKRQTQAAVIDEYLAFGMEVMELHRDFGGFEGIKKRIPNPSVHLPGRKIDSDERRRTAIAALESGIERIIVHPENLTNDSFWREMGARLLIENLDPRSPAWRTATQLYPVFESLPEAGLCLDVAHAAQEPGIIEELIQVFGTRTRQIHLSEIDYSTGRHLPRSSDKAMAAAIAWLNYFPIDIPVVVELASVTWENALAEVQRVAACRASLNKKRLKERVCEKNQSR